MLLGIVATCLENPGTPSSGSRGRTQKMNKKLISSCFYDRFSIIPAVIRCYFRRQNPKLTTKSTSCPAGGVNFPVFTANAARTSPRPSTPLRSSILVRGQGSCLLSDHSRASHRSLFTLHGSRFPLHPSPFTLHVSRFPLHPSPFTAYWNEFQTMSGLSVFRALSSALRHSNLGNISPDFPRIEVS